MEQYLFSTSLLTTLHNSLHITVVNSRASFEYCKPLLSSNKITTQYIRLETKLLETKNRFGEPWSFSKHGIITIQNKNSRKYHLGKMKTPVFVCWEVFIQINVIIFIS